MSGQNEYDFPKQLRLVNMLQQGSQAFPCKFCELLQKDRFQVFLRIILPVFCFHIFYY